MFTYKSNGISRFPVFTSDLMFVLIVVLSLIRPVELKAYVLPPNFIQLISGFLSCLNFCKSHLFNMIIQLAERKYTIKIQS